MEWMLGLAAKAIYGVALLSSNAYCLFMAYEPRIPEALRSKED